MTTHVSAYDETTPDDVLRHIRECDRMYREIYGGYSNEPSKNPCRKLITLGFQLTQENLPELCIQHCERWKLPRTGTTVK